MSKKIPIVERKLGREKALGQCHANTMIEVDPTQDSRERLNTLVHETLHFVYPDFPERKVIFLADAITEVLWDQRYRRVEK